MKLEFPFLTSFAPLDAGRNRELRALRVFF